MRAGMIAALSLLLGSGLACQEQPRTQIYHAPPSPAARVRVRLLELHPDWHSLPYGAFKPRTPVEWDSSFHQRGYLSIYAKIAEYPDVWMLKILGDGTPEEIDKSRLRSDDWRGLIYVRSEGPRPGGWYGRVLVRADCLFFGDREMLKEIDKDLQ